MSQDMHARLDAIVRLVPAGRRSFLRSLLASTGLGVAALTPLSETLAQDPAQDGDGKGKGADGKGKGGGAAKGKGGAAGGAAKGKGGGKGGGKGKGKGDGGGNEAQPAGNAGKCKKDAAPGAT